MCNFMPVLQQWTLDTDMQGVLQGPAGTWISSSTATS